MANKGSEKLYKALREMSEDNRSADSLIERHKSIVNELNNTLTVAPTDEAEKAKSLKSQLDQSAKNLIEVSKVGEKNTEARLGLLDGFNQELGLAEDFLGMGVENTSDYEEKLQVIETFKGLDKVFAPMYVYYDADTYTNAYLSVPKEYRVPVKDIRSAFDQLYDWLKKSDTLYEYMTTDDSGSGKEQSGFGFRMEGEVLNALHYFCHGDDEGAMLEIRKIIDFGDGIEESLNNSESLFGGFNKKLGLSRTALAAYFNSYMGLPESKRIPVEEIESKLKDVEKNFLTELEGKARKDVLVQIFGKLVSGETEGLVPNDLLYTNSVSLDEKIEALQENIEKRQKEIEEFQKLGNRAFKNAGKTVKNRPGWLGESILWATGNDKVQELNDDNLRDYLKRGETNLWRAEHIQRFISMWQDQIKELQKLKTVNQYQMLANSGMDTKEFLLGVGRQFGRSCPVLLKEKVSEAVKAHLKDPNISDFDKAFFTGKYDKAMKALIERNKERAKHALPGMVYTNGLTYHDLVAMYRKGPSEKLTAKAKKMKTFAGEKVRSEGYEVYGVRAFTPGRRGNFGHNHFFLIKKLPDGGISYYAIAKDGRMLFESNKDTVVGKSHVKEHKVSSEDLKKYEREGGQFRANVAAILVNKPSIKRSQKAAAELSKQFSPLTSLLQAAAGGANPEFFVKRVKGYAKELRKSSESGALKQLRSNLGQAQQDVKNLLDLGAGFLDETELKLQQMAKSFDQVNTLISNGKIENICDYIESSDFTAESIGRWALKDAIPFLVMIGAAVTGMLLMPTGWGTALGWGAWGVAAELAAGAAVGTAAGMAGNEVASRATHYAGKYFYGEDFNNLTYFQKRLAGEKVIDPETGKYKQLSWEQLGEIYGKQFAAGFLMCFAAMGIGYMAAPYLTRFAAAHAGKKGFKAIIAKFINKFERFRPEEIDLLSQKGLDSFMSKLGHEYFSEIREELTESGVQTGADKLKEGVGGPFAFIASVFFATRSRSVEHKLGSHDVVAESSVRADGNIVKTEFTFDANQTSDIVDSLATELGPKGFEVSVDPETGNIIAKTDYTTKSGETFTNTMIFKPSFEPHSMRKAFREGADKQGIGNLERDYGVQKVGENLYSFDNASPGGKADLARYFRSRGFIVEGDPNSGDFEVRMGDEVTRFVSGNVSTNAEAGVDSSIDTDMRVPKPEVMISRSLDSLGLEINSDGTVEIDEAAKGLSLQVLLGSQGFEIVRGATGFTAKRGATSIEVKLTLEAATQMKQMIADLTSVMTELRSVAENPNSTLAQRSHAVNKLRVVFVNLSFSGAFFFAKSARAGGVGDTLKGWWNTLGDGVVALGDGVTEGLGLTAQGVGEISVMAGLFIVTCAYVGVPVGVYAWGHSAYGDLAKWRRVATKKPDIRSKYWFGAPKLWGGHANIRSKVRSDVKDLNGVKNEINSAPQLQVSNTELVTMLDTQLQHLETFFNTQMKNIDKGVYEFGPLKGAVKEVGESIRDLRELIEVSKVTGSIDEEEFQLKMNVLKDQTELLVKGITGNGLFMKGDALSTDPKYNKADVKTKINALIGLCASIAYFLWLFGKAFPNSFKGGSQKESGEGEGDESDSDSESGIPEAPKVGDPEVKRVDGGGSSDDEYLGDDEDDKGSKKDDEKPKTAAPPTPKVNPTDLPGDDWGE